MSLSISRILQHPIALRLPNEILIEICRLNVDGDKAHRVRICRRQYNTHHHPPSLQDIINASHVCRQWRYALTQCPQLWRNFINPRHRHQEWTRLLLERSYPLGINYTPSDPFDLSFNDFKLEVAHGGRLESYSILFPKDSEIWSSDGFPNQWPRLKFLCVYHPWHNQPEGSRGDLRYSLPDNFPCRTSTPQLERLHLHFCFLAGVEQIAGMGDTLTELYVQRTVRGLAFSIAQWIRVISSLPRLRRLYLDRAVSEYVDVDEERLDLRQVHRLNLDEFYFQDDVDACVKIMKCFDLTRTTRIFRLMCYNIHRDEGHLVEFIVSRTSPIVTNLLSKQELFQRCCLYIGGGEFNCISIPDGCQAHPPWPKDEGEFDGGQVEIQFKFLRGRLPLENFYHAVMRSFQPVCDRIAFLSMSERMGCTLSGADTFSNLLLQNSDHLLGIIDISMSLWRTIYHYLFSGGDRPTASDVQCSDGHFLSALKELHIFQLGSPELYEEEVQAFYEQITQFCEHKKVIGCPMRLVAVSFLVGKEIVERLGELGVELRAASGLMHTLH